MTLRSLFQVTNRRSSAVLVGGPRVGFTRGDFREVSTDSQLEAALFPGCRTLRFQMVRVWSLVPRARLLKAQRVRKVSALEMILLQARSKMTTLTPLE